MNLLNRFLKLLFSTTFRQISSHSLSSEAGWIKALVNPDWQSPLKQTNITAAVIVAIQPIRPKYHCFFYGFEGFEFHCFTDKGKIEESRHTMRYVDAISNSINVL